jgi:SHS2 domain-containing protein
MKISAKPMQKFEILPHTADTRLKVTANTLNGLFQAGLEGMNCIMKNALKESDLTGDFAKKIIIKSLDESMLLIDFLSEVLTLSHKNKACYKIIGFEILDSTKLTAVIEGTRVFGFDEDIKAVTYTEAKIVKNSLNQYETIIVFDI